VQNVVEVHQCNTRNEGTTKIEFKLINVACPSQLLQFALGLEGDSELQNRFEFDSKARGCSALTNFGNAVKVSSTPLLISTANGMPSSPYLLPTTRVLLGRGNLRGVSTSRPLPTEAEHPRRQMIRTLEEQIHHPRKMLSKVQHLKRDWSSNAYRNLL